MSCYPYTTSLPHPLAHFTPTDSFFPRVCFNRREGGWHQKRTVRFVRSLRTVFFSSFSWSCTLDWARLGIHLSPSVSLYLLHFSSRISSSSPGLGNVRVSPRCRHQPREGQTSLITRSLSVSSSFFARSLSYSSYHEPVLSSWLLSNLVCFCLVRSRLVLSRPVLASPSTTTALHAPVT